MDLITKDIVVRIAEIEKGVAGAMPAVIENNEHYALAVDVCKVIKAKANELETTRKSITAPLDESKKAVMDYFRKPLEYLASAESRLKAMIIAYQQAEEKRRIETEAKLKADALALAEKERRALDEKAKQAQADGDFMGADEAIEEKAKVVAYAPVVAPAIPTQSGVSTRKIWKFEITDAQAIPRAYLIPNEMALRKIAGTGVAVPGVRFYSEDTLAVSKGGK